MKTKALYTFLSGIARRDAGQRIDDILDLLDDFESVNLSDWTSLLHYENGQPATTVLYESDQIKLSLIYWHAGKESSVHGHPAGGGLIQVLAGSLKERRFDPDNPATETDIQIIRAGDIGYIHDMLALHQMSNPSDQPAVSLHMYALSAAS